MHPTLSLHILRHHIGPFLFAILVITFLFIMDLLIDYIDLFLGKGISLLVVLEVFFLSLGWMVALTFPMGTLVATVMAFGRLSGENEITAMKSAGVSIYQILAPPLIVSVFLSFGLVQFNNHVLPDSNHRLASLLVNIHKKRPALAIKAGMFNDIQGYTIRVENMDARTSEIEGVVIQKNDRGEGENETIVADEGVLRFSEDGDVLTIFLRNGEIHAVDDENRSRYHKISFDTHTIRITDIGSELARSEKKTRGDRELSAGDMLERVHVYEKEIEALEREKREKIGGHLSEKFEILRWHGPPLPGRERFPALMARKNYSREMRNLGTKIVSKAGKIRDREKQVNRYMVEVHKKYALPGACIVFILVGGPLGIRAHRGGLGVGVGFSIVFFVIYYLFLIGGEKLADRGHLPPAVAMWAANVLLGLLGIILVVRTSRDMSDLPLLGRFQAFRLGRKRKDDGADKEGR